MADTATQPVDQLDDIESQLLGGDTLTASKPQHDPNAFAPGQPVRMLSQSIDPHGRYEIAKTLYGDEALEFLGIGRRPFNRLIQGDVSIIEEKFKGLLEKLAKDGAHGGADQFWDKIKINVQKNTNIEGFDANAEQHGMEGKQMNGHVDGVKTKSGKRDAGCIFTGSQMISYLSEVAHAEKHLHYTVRLVSIDVTKEMVTHAQRNN